MSAFKRFFTGVTDTSENAKDERLRTRYYRGEQRKVCQIVADFVKREKDLKLVHVNDNRGEIMVEYRDSIGFIHDLVVTVFAVTPVQSAVDIHTAMRSRMFDFGFNVRLINRIYKYLDNQLTQVV